MKVFLSLIIFHFGFAMLFDSGYPVCLTGSLPPQYTIERVKFLYVEV
jgi:hypothetical protein